MTPFTSNGTLTTGIDLASLTTDYAAYVLLGCDYLLAPFNNNQCILFSEGFGIYPGDTWGNATLFVAQNW